MIAPRLHPVLADQPGLLDPDLPVAVFVHGIEDDCRVWKSLARCLGPQWSALTMCMPWRAGNDYRWMSGDTPGAWIKAGLAGLERPPDLIVGHSFGATALLELLAVSEQPPAAGAVLMAPFFRRPDAPMTWRTMQRSHRLFQRQLGDGVRVRLADRTSPPQADVVESMLIGAWDRTGPSAFLAVFGLYVASAQLPLTSADLPVLVVAGERDPGLVHSDLEDLVARLPRASLLFEPEYDHFCHLRQAPELARAIDRFAYRDWHQGGR